MAKFRTVLVAGDVHCPHHDPQAVKTLLSTVQAQPTEIVLLGDITDCESISKFTVAPERVAGFQAELDATADFLGQIRKAAPKARITYLQGNHEHRMQTYLYTHAKAFSALRCLELGYLLGLSKLNIALLPYGAPLELAPGFIATHGTTVRARAGYSGYAEYQKHGCSGISGHTHRLAMNYYRDYSKSSFWIENGCLCRLDPEYVVGTPDWQQGFTTLIIEGSKVDPRIHAL